MNITLPVTKCSINPPSVYYTWPTRGEGVPLNEYGYSVRHFSSSRAIPQKAGHACQH
ncbi:hypothetical protein KCP74_11460 [Salmonella enterica subsp. enterica]|nr:hypothetical protein KCP74_11460 [Salmonella enterica subsp. enterica]